VCFVCVFVCVCFVCVCVCVCLCVCVCVCVMNVCVCVCVCPPRTRVVAVTSDPWVREHASIAWQQDHALVVLLSYPFNRRLAGDEMLTRRYVIYYLGCLIGMKMG
jgi:hypothetical protein